MPSGALVFRVVRALIGSALISALLACSQHTPPPPTSSGAPPPPFAKSGFEQFSQQDPCNLVNPKEVEAALGAPLAVPPYRSANATVDPTPSGESCVYETANFRYITLDVTYEGGSKVYSMTSMVKNLMKSGGNADIHNNVKKNFKLDDGTELAGEWDEASLTPLNCCIFSALRGDQLITIDFTASPATLRQAALLVDSAYKRMDHPLKIDGGAAVAAARALDKTRPHPVDVCSILTRDEVEAIIGKLTAEPVSRGKDSCTYELPAQQGVPQQYEVVVHWRGGYADSRSEQHVSKIGGAAIGQIADDVAKQMGATPPPRAQNDSSDAAAAGAAAPPAAGPSADPAESVTNTGLHLAAVKRDVRVSVAGNFVESAKAKALVGAVLQKT
jgi:hypothetical protein